MSTFAIGSKVSFKPGPRSIGKVVGEVTKIDGAFLVTKDVSTGQIRKIRPGACTAA